MYKSSAYCKAAGVNTGVLVWTVMSWPKCLHAQLSYKALVLCVLYFANNQKLGTHTRMR